MSKNILVILGHSDIEASVANVRLVEELKECDNVTVRALKSLYPNGEIDVYAEQDALLQADKIVLQFPLYWFNCPPILKEYLDTVFSYGFAFELDESGYSAKALVGKEFMLAVTVGGEEKLYSAKDAMSVESCLTPFYETAKFVGMLRTEPYYLYGAMPELISQESLDKEAINYKQAILR